jgi:mono/diheme cytochrome c family protein
MDDEYRRSAPRPPHRIEARDRAGSVAAMRTPRALFAGMAVVAAATAMAACSGGGQSAPPTPTDPVLAQGQQIYQQKCASCHGKGGGGGLGVKLADVVESRYPNIEDQIAVIAEGKGNMQAFGDELSQEEMMAVARYEREVLGTN